MDLQSDQVANFDWKEYLAVIKGQPAKVECFKQNPWPPENHFTDGMLLEAADLRSAANSSTGGAGGGGSRQSLGGPLDHHHHSGLSPQQPTPPPAPRRFRAVSYSLASVVDSKGPRLRLRLIGTDDKNDLWSMVDSDQIRPYPSGEDLQPPFGFMHNHSVWHRTLKKVVDEGNFAANHCFGKPPSDPGKNQFVVGTKLEAVDRRNPQLICPATVGALSGEYILVSFDGWKGAFDYWARYDSRDLFPVGWCARANYQLQLPGPNTRYTPTITVVKVGAGHNHHRTLRSSPQKRSSSDLYRPEKSERSKRASLSVKRKLTLRVSDLSPKKLQKHGKTRDTPDSNTSKTSESESSFDVSSVDDSHSHQYPSPSTTTSRYKEKLTEGTVKKLVLTPHSEKPSQEDKKIVESKSPPLISAVYKKPSQPSIQQETMGRSAGDSFVRHYNHHQQLHQSSKSIPGMISDQPSRALVNQKHQLPPTGSEIKLESSSKFKNVPSRESIVSISSGTSTAPPLWSMVPTPYPQEPLTVSVSNPQIPAIINQQHTIMSSRPSHQQQMMSSCLTTPLAASAATCAHSPALPPPAHRPTLSPPSPHHKVPIQLHPPPAHSKLSSSSSSQQRYHQPPTTSSTPLVVKQQITSFPKITGTFCLNAQIKKDADLPTNPRLWTPEEVAFYLQTRDPCLGSVASTFIHHEIDGQALLLLNMDSLRHFMGVKLGPALKIEHYINQLKRSL